jgi:hypothetical protein
MKWRARINLFVRALPNSRRRPDLAFNPTNLFVFGNYPLVGLHLRSKTPPSLSNGLNSIFTNRERLFLRCSPKNHIVRK